MKAYKVFNPDWTCKEFQYEMGKIYEIEGEPILCQRGFHACKKVSDCFRYYTFDPSNKVAEVELLGTIVGGDEDKQATNKIRIVKELSWSEVLELANTGKGNSGNQNSGNQNSGHWNSGYQNSGHWNSGNQNSGHWNSGHWNSGNQNSGHWNSGYQNSGHWNSGNQNSGLFNTNEPFVRMFNKDTTVKSSNLNFPNILYFDLASWVSHDSATEEEKVEHKIEIEACGGFLKALEYKEAFQRAWANGSEEDKEAVKALPNFDADIFYEISGIRV
jgi:hypothetical protein